MNDALNLFVAPDDGVGFPFLHFLDEVICEVVEHGCFTLAVRLPAFQLFRFHARHGALHANDGTLQSLEEGFERLLHIFTLLLELVDLAEHLLDVRFQVFRVHLHLLEQHGCGILLSRDECMEEMFCSNICMTEFMCCNNALLDDIVQVGGESMFDMFSLHILGFHSFEQDAHVLESNPGTRENGKTQRFWDAEEPQEQVL